MINTFLLLTAYIIDNYGHMTKLMVVRYKMYNYGNLPAINPHFIEITPFSCILPELGKSL